ncbi:MAG: BMP family ABC transporter substrate-binding protein [Chloroflexota bacterium]|nr:BMP family ABC transporter substrate-binding protein [Chloroflexota bacterium]
MRNKVAALIGLSALLVGAVGTTVLAQEPLIESVCLVTDFGGIDDGGFNQYANEGMIAAGEDFGLDTTAIETQAQTDYENNINTCLDEGYDTIITVGFLITDATLAAAEANPDTYFIGVDQFIPEGSPENFVGVQFREDQAGFLAGAMAALMTESGTIGGVYGIAIPPVVKFRNGFEQGAHYIDPDVTVLSLYIDDFNAQDRGAAAAEQFIGEGADVIFGAGGNTGNGAIKFGASVGVWVIGVDQDQYNTVFEGGVGENAEYIITSATKQVNQAVYLSLQALAEGDLETFSGGGVRVLSAENDGVGFAPSHDADVPADVTEQVQTIFEGLKDGSIETGVDPISGELLMMDPNATPEAGA